MAELKIRIRYNQIESLLELKEKLKLAEKNGFRRAELFQQQLQQIRQQNLILTREVITFLGSHCFDIKFNVFKLSIGKIEPFRFLQIVDNLKNCPYLTILMVPGNNLTDEGIAKLCQCRFLFISDLDLSSNALTAQSLRHLSSCVWKYLVKFWIGGNKIGNKGMHFLAKSQWNKLRYLSLNHTHITDDGIRPLIKGMWPKLECLDLSKNNIGTQGFKTLTFCTWKKLQFVSLKHNDCNQKPKNFIWVNQYCKFFEKGREELLIEYSIEANLQQRKTLKTFENVVKAIV